MGKIERLKIDGHELNFQRIAGTFHRILRLLVKIELHRKRQLRIKWTIDRPLWLKRSSTIALANYLSK